MKPIFQHPALRRAIVKTNGCWLAAALLLLATTATPAAESLSVLLQKAIFAEETEGNLDAAIKIYDNILKQGEANRSVMAQAQYRLGVCELKRGKKNEAEGAFRRIASQFADQIDINAKARERLAEMGKSESSVVVRQIWAGPGAACDAISPDGRLLSFVDWNTGNLMLRDLTSGQIRRLTSNASWQTPVQFASSDIFSPDGTQVAYSWFKQTGAEDGQCEVHVISLDDSKDRLLFSRNNAQVKAIGWSIQHSALVVQIWTNKPSSRREYELSLVSMKDGSIRVLKPFGNRQLWNAAVSPDGESIVYSCHNGNEQECDIFRLDIGSGAEESLLQHPANDRLVDWIPNGKGVLFTSDRRGTSDLWLLPLEIGKAAGDAVLVKADLGAISPVGLTTNGNLYYTVYAKSSEMCVASLDFDTGKLLSPLKPVPCRFSEIIKPRFSADGKLMAFNKEIGGKDKFYVQNLANGEIREYANYPDMPGRTHLIFSPDSENLLIRGWPKAKGNGLYVLNRTTGELATISLAGPESEIEYWTINIQNDFVRYSFWEAKSNRLTWVRHELKTRTKRERAFDNLPARLYNAALIEDDRYLLYLESSQIVSGTGYYRAALRELETGKESELLRDTNRIEFRAASSSSVALLIWNPGESDNTLKVLDITGNTVVERLTVKLPVNSQRVFWGWHGSKPHLLFTKPTGEGNDTVTEIWTVSGENGQLHKTECAFAGDVAPVNNIQLVGKNELFFQRTRSQLGEVWAMENFLSAPISSK